MVTIDCCISMDGNIRWKLSSKTVLFKFHNNNGPAIEYLSGKTCWLINNEFHRLDGPAIKYSSGVKKWYINDIEYETEFDYWIAVQNYVDTH